MVRHSDKSIEVRMQELDQLPCAGFLRLKDVLKIIPVCRSTWYNGVGTIYPKPVKIGKRAVGYRVEDIRKLIENSDPSRI